VIPIKTYLITGGAGFIGSNFIEYMIDKYQNQVEIIVLDKLTYAGNLITIEKFIDDIKFIKGDIINNELVEYIFTKYNIDYIVNFAAESHVDKSIKNPYKFIKTNVLGTQNLLEIARQNWQSEHLGYRENVKFIQVSTDEVYGSLDDKGCFTEETPLSPNSPYAASKAGADMLVKSYIETYKFPALITRCSNNYGPKQFPEKLIPVVIQNIIKGKQVPIYGNGKQVRDWIYVKDHIRALDQIISNGALGEVYNIGANNEKKNIEVVKDIIDNLKKVVFEKENYKKCLETNISNISYNLIKFVEDRLGHDRRYAIDNNKLKTEVGWEAYFNYRNAIVETIKWYLKNQNWVEKVLKK
jgi:dTDP-glucose 4,6-dehydratase